MAIKEWSLIGRHGERQKAVVVSVEIRRIWVERVGRFGEDITSYPAPDDEELRALIGNRMVDAAAASRGVKLVVAIYPVGEITEQEAIVEAEAWLNGLDN